MKDNSSLSDRASTSDELEALAARCEREEWHRDLLSEVVGVVDKYDPYANLVPVGWRVAHIEQYLVGGSWGCTLKSNDPAHGGSADGVYACGVAKTEEGARCAAALRARAALAKVQA